MTPLLALVHDGSLRLEVSRRGRVLWTTEQPCDTPALLEAELAAVRTLEGIPRGLRTLNVQFGRGLVQHRSLRGLPPIGAGALDDLVSLQRTRFFRSSEHDLTTAASWQARRRNEASIASAVAIDREWLDALANGARRAGLRLGRVTPSGVPRLSLLPDATRRERDAARRRITRFLVIAGIMLWLGAASVYLLRLRLMERQLASTIARLQAPASAVLEARRALDRAAAMLDTMRRAGLRRRAAEARIATIVGALPDSALLLSLQADSSGVVKVSGLGRPAAAVLAGWATHAELSPVRLEGVPEPDPGDARWERFAATLGTRERFR